MGQPLIQKLILIKLRYSALWRTMMNVIIKHIFKCVKFRPYFDI